MGSIFFSFCNYQKEEQRLTFLYLARARLTRALHKPPRARRAEKKRLVSVGQTRGGPLQNPPLQYYHKYRCIKNTTYNYINTKVIKSK